MDRLAAAAVVRRRSGGFRPVPWGAAELAARHECIDLVNERPDLWPVLNALTLRSHQNEVCGGVDWCDTLRLLVREAHRPRHLRAA